MNRSVTVCGLCMLSVIMPVFFAGGLMHGLRAEEAATVNSPLVRRGAEIFVNNCSQCHYADKTETKIGPGLKGLFQRDQLPFRKVPVTEDAIISQLRFPYKQMPPFRSLTNERIDALIAYLKTL